MQNWLDAMTTRIDKAEEWISDIKDKIMGKNEAEKKRERKVLYHECRLRELSVSIKHSYIHNNIHIIGILEEEGKRGQKVYLSKLWLKTSLIWGRKQTSQFKRFRELPSKSAKAGRHQDILIVNFTKYIDEERILKVAREKKSLTHREDKSGSQQICSQKLGRPETSSRKYSMCWMGKTRSQESFIQQGCHSEQKER